jgi:dolichol-phosphate mannosyltransferase
MESSPKVVVVPFAYNEGEKIHATLSRFPAERNYDIVVMDDGSTDGSLDGVEEAYGVKKVLRHEVNRGIGAAFQTVFDYILEQGYDIFVAMAGNNKDDPTQIPRLLTPILEWGYDFVQGSRFMPGGYYGETPFYRVIATRFVHPWTFLLATGYPLTESSNGFRAFRTELLRDPRINWRQDWLNKYELEPYLLYYAVRLGYRHTEVPASKVYPPKKLGYTKMQPITGWWAMIKPLILLGLGLKK